jgi:predicted O-linked N-acetylglucosamine transferase (SPINDLY family)
MAHQDYLALLKLADVMLDPFYFGGGTTSFEALALGLPVVTWPGERLHGRITAAYYKQMGLDELIASSPENYLERALALGQDAICNQKLRAQLLLRAHTLFERQMAVAELAVCLIGLAQKSLKTRI